MGLRSITSSGTSWPAGEGVDPAWVGIGDGADVGASGRTVAGDAGSPELGVDLAIGTPPPVLGSVGDPASGLDPGSEQANSAMHAATSKRGGLFIYPLLF